MTLRYTFLFLLLCLSCSNNKDLSSDYVLNKSFSFHDPHDKWTAFNDSFIVKMSTPDETNRTSLVEINKPKSSFSLSVDLDSVRYKYQLDSDNQCSIMLNDSTDISTARLQALNLSCDRAEMYKNYYSYLYGLPMKITDPGAIIDKKVVRVRFKDKDYLKLRVAYDKAVGTDVWYFYFNPDNYALEVYQFYKTDDSGQEIMNSGEYILLSGIEEVGGIKMPKARAWYYNKDDAYLGTDTLIKNTSQAID